MPMRKQAVTATFSVRRICRCHTAKFAVSISSLHIIESELNRGASLTIHWNEHNHCIRDDICRNQALKQLDLISTFPINNGQVPLERHRCAHEYDSQGLSETPHGNDAEHDISGETEACRDENPAVEE
jgi:hypothetical protein